MFQLESKGVRNEPITIMREEHITLIKIGGECDALRKELYGWGAVLQNNTASHEVCS